MVEAIVAECVEYLKQLGVPVGKVVEVKINKRARTRWGQCKEAYGGYSIEVSERLCDGKHDEGLRNTILHELLHTCPECLNHGPKWKRWARIVSEASGMVISRTSSSAEKGVGTSREWKYKLVCVRCGHTYWFLRKGKYVRQYRSCICHKCGGRLRLVENDLYNK